jgi:hypothetical protein
MARPKWVWNLNGFAQLRQHPALVEAMTSSMLGAATGTPFEVEVWPHEGSGSGRGGGPRTSVQAWARTSEARDLLDRNPGALHEVLARTGIPFEAKFVHVTRSGKVRTATQAQRDHWTRGRS